jgi:hypothetical protein
MVSRAFDLAVALPKATETFSVCSVRLLLIAAIFASVADWFCS